MPYFRTVLRRIVDLEKKIIFQLACIVFLLISHFFLSYDFNGGWWHSLAGSSALLVFGCMIWGRQFFYVSGLKMPFKTLIIILLAAVLFTALSALIQWFIAGRYNISIRPANLTNYTHAAFYILNEEIILGAMMLYLLVRRFKVKAFNASLGLALVFSLAHLVLYKWYFRDKGFLDLSTLITLTLFIFVKNNLIIRHKHIGYAWALHFGWMAVMYSSFHYRDPETLLTDLEKFNLYLGSFPLLLVSVFMAGADLLYYFPLKKKSVEPN